MYIVQNSENSKEREEINVYILSPLNFTMCENYLIKNKNGNYLVKTYVHLRN